jgi:hypothetical protein
MLFYIFRKITFLKNLKIFDTTALKNYNLFDPTISPQHIHTYTEHLTLSELRNLENEYAKINMKNVEKNFRYNLKILNKIIEVTHKKHLKLVLFDTPINPLVPVLYRDQFNQYIKILEGYKHIKHIRFREDSKSDFFHDTSHLNPEGKKYYYHYMIKGLHDAIYS